MILAMFSGRRRSRDRAPLLEVDGIAVDDVVRLDLLKPRDRRRAVKEQARLLVELERAEVDVARSDEAQFSVDADVLGVQQEVAKLVDADARGEQLLEI